MAELVWVGFFWGRQNPREHRRYSAAPKTCQKIRNLSDFAAPSLINVDFEARFEPFLRAGFPTLMREGRGGRKWKSKMPTRINIDEGGGQNPSLMSPVLALYCRRDHENRSIPNKESIIFERSREKARQNRPKWEGLGKILLRLCCTAPKKNQLILAQPWGDFSGCWKRGILFAFLGFDLDEKSCSEQCVQTHLQHFRANQVSRAANGRFSNSKCAKTAQNAQKIDKLSIFK